MHCTAICPDIAQQRLAILCGPIGIGGPDRERKILQIGFNVAEICIARRPSTERGRWIQDSCVKADREQRGQAILCSLGGEKLGVTGLTCSWNYRHVKLYLRHGAAYT